MASKGAPKMRQDPLAKVTAARKAANAASRKPAVKGTFKQGTKSATSSNASRKSSAFSGIKPLKGKGAGSKQRRDGKGRFA